MDTGLEKHWRTSQPDLGEKIEELLAVSGGADSGNVALYREMLWSLMRMVQGNADRWDVKITTHALRELERAFSTLAQFKRRRKVTIFGSARVKPADRQYELARRLGALLARDDFMVITGAGPGIMEAANEGAGPENSIGLNINLPFEQEANTIMQGSPGLLEFKYFFTRKLFFVKEADAVVLFPGGFGTLDEAMELLTLVQTGKSPLIPIILMEEPGGTYWEHWKEFVSRDLLGNGYISPHDLSLLRFANDSAEVCAEIEQFYSNFHSARWVGDELRLRMNRSLPEVFVTDLNAAFSDICEGTIRLTGEHVEEAEEPELRNLPRLSFRFNHHDYGRLRQLIDAINSGSVS